MSIKKKYDLICSLGGNCSACHNLIYRNLRLCAFPFDWLYMKEDTVLLNLAKCFANNFSNFMLKENMKFITHEEFGPNGHNDRIFYQDIETGYYFLNHFNKKIDENFEYENVKKIMDRRLERFKKILQKSKNILFVLSNSFEVEEEKILYLGKTLNELYPDKNIEIKSIQFNSKNKITKEKTLQNYNIEIFRYERPNHSYDYIETNFEWNFLDGIELNQKLYTEDKIIDCIKTKKGIQISLLPILKTFAYVKFYLFGFRFQLFLGRIKNDY